ncbi:hypothetical protein VSU16_16290 (plasmid) [Cetobacterium somerae]|uniref:hypothetical protein n=1 Tax=Cetobacterium TaxID=180162 RepID=UPI000648FAD3|nr:MULTISPECIES: hypothetical protein [Cetobacterium]WVJ03390.1 hypothetical protein VSU16_16290 [Cetobacterium somerae]
MENLLNKLNLLSKTFNEVTEIKSRLQDKPVSEEYIREYFKILKYILKKYNNQQSLNIGSLTGAKILEKEVIKNNLTDVMMISINGIIERTFNDINEVIAYDKELKLHKEMRDFMLELTPIIKSKLKIRLKENSDYLKQIAECR